MLVVSILLLIIVVSSSLVIRFFNEFNISSADLPVAQIKKINPYFFSYSLFNCDNYSKTSSFDSLP
jgi:ABC-type Mn2+/Zn2+ transport system permease subunit